VHAVCVNVGQVKNEEREEPSGARAAFRSRKRFRSVIATEELVNDYIFPHAQVGRNFTKENTCSALPSQDP
jgi:argininosuccinate synthase